MYKLMRRFLILTAICLAFATTPTPPVSAAGCGAEQAVVVAYAMAVEVACNSGTGDECYDAKVEYASAKIKYVACLASAVQ